MWGSDYPHDEGTGPFTTEHLRQVFHDADPDELVPGPRRQRGEALRLRPRRRLAPLAEQYGPTVEELAQPLTELPENPNMALIRGAAGTKLIA